MSKHSGKKPNATLEWTGRKLMCNGVCVSWVDYAHCPDGKKRWMTGIYFNRLYASEGSARRAVNRRFKLTEET